jgi:hypothetical protein
LNLKKLEVAIIGTKGTKSSQPYATDRSKKGEGTILSEFTAIVQN